MVVQDDDDPDIAVAVDRVAGKRPHVFQKPGLESQPAGACHVVKSLAQRAINSCNGEGS